MSRERREKARHRAHLARRHLLWVVAACLVLTAAVYWQVTGAEFVNYDDDILVTQNPAVRNFDVGRMASDRQRFQDFIPFTMTVWATEHSIAGFDPTVFHAVSLAVHLANTVLVLLLAFRLSDRNLHVAALCGLLFALHPVQVESVAWIAEGKGLLAAFWGLLSLHAYVSYATGSRRALYFGAALAAFVLACLSKSSAMTLPLILLVLDLYLGRISKSRRVVLGLLMEKLPFLLVAVAVAIVAWNVRVKAPSEGISLLAPAKALAFYAGKLLWPADLSIYYQRGVATVGWLDYASLGLLAAGFTAAAHFVPALRRPITFGLLFFAVAIAPMLKLFPYARDFAFADRYLYFPLVGLLFAFAAAFDGAVRAASTEPVTRRGLWVIAGAAIFALAFVTHGRAADWKSSGALWSAAIESYPRTAMAHHNLALWHAGEGRVDKALRHLERAVALSPRFEEARYNLGREYQRRGNTAAAIEQYQAAIEIAPDYSEANNNLGVLYESIGKPDEAAKRYHAAIAASPRFADAHLNLGNVLFRQNDLAAAIRAYETAIRYRPDMAEAHNNLGVARFRAGDLAGAARSLERALALGSGHPQIHGLLAEIHRRLGNDEAAREHERRAR